MTIEPSDRCADWFVYLPRGVDYGVSCWCAIFSRILVDMLSISSWLTHSLFGSARYCIAPMPNALRRSVNKAWDDVEMHVLKPRCLREEDDVTLHSAGDYFERS